MGEWVARAVEAIAKSGLKYEVGPMGTCVEAESVEEALAVVAKAERALVEAGAKRTYTLVKIDHRLDRGVSLEGKVERVRELLEGQ